MAATEIDKISAPQAFRSFSGELGLTSHTTPSKNAFENAVRKVKGHLYRQEEDEGFLAVVSTVCPPYSTDEDGRPNYQGLDEGISYNIQRHLTVVPQAVKSLEEMGLPVVHLFLMADTEVDLHPFLEGKLGITPEEFLRRCDSSLAVISERVRDIYGESRYEKFGISPADRFLNYFGGIDWYMRYNYYKDRLVDLVQKDPENPLSVKLSKDLNIRRPLIASLLGDFTTEQGVAHIARQKAQYMAFGDLIRHKFDKKAVVVNHSTPNITAINHEFVRDNSSVQKLSIFELDISTIPED